MKKLVLAFIILLLVATQIILPGFLSDKITSSLKQELEESDILEVKASSFPAFKMLIGRFDDLKVTGEGVAVDQLLISRVEADFTDLKLVKEEEKWKIVKGNNTYLDLELTEDGLNQYLKTKSELDIFENFKVELLPNKVMILANIKFFNYDVNLQLSGNFIVANQEKIIFNSNKLAVENIVIPTSQIKELKNKLQFEISFADLPFPLQINQVNLGKDRLEILGINE